MRFVILPALLLFAAGCTGQEPLPGGAPPPPTQAMLLAPGDKLRIMTFGEESLSGEFAITPAGTIAFPLIGGVKAAGIDTGTLSLSIQNALREGGYVIDPRVSVEVAAYRPVYILGEVNKPGEYPFTQGLTVRGVVAKANGFTYRANQKRVFIKRAGAAGEEMVPLTADLLVMPGDTIRFAERYF